MHIFSYNFDRVTHNTFVGFGISRHEIKYPFYYIKSRSQREEIELIFVPIYLYHWEIIIAWVNSVSLGPSFKGKRLISLRIQLNESINRRQLLSSFYCYPFPPFVSQTINTCRQLTSLPSYMQFKTTV